MALPGISQTDTAAELIVVEFMYEQLVTQDEFDLYTNLGEKHDEHRYAAGEPKEEDCVAFGREHADMHWLAVPFTM